MGKIKEFRKTNYKWDSELWKSVQPQRKPNSNLPKYFFTLSNWQKYRSLTTYSVGEAIVNRHLIQCCQFSRSVVSNSLQPHGLQHARPPCPPPTPRVYSNWCWLSRWCHPTISSSVIPFSSRLQSFPALGSFPKSQFFTSSGQSWSFSFSISSSNEY